MRRLLSFGILGVTLIGSLSACVVREERVAHAGGPCRGGVWVEGYRGPRGRWHEGHWRCPGVVERVEVY
jgi:hypothetical protein